MSIYAGATTVVNLLEHRQLSKVTSPDGLPRFQSSRLDTAVPWRFSYTTSEAVAVLSYAVNGESIAMNKVVLRSVCPVVLAISLLWLTGSSATAMKPFHDEFVAKYVKPDSTDKKEKAFAEAAQAAKCSICHQGKTKAVRNVYGRALGRYLSEDDAENKEKIRTALDKAAQVKSNPDDPRSPTFGDLIKAGKLPAGAARSSANKTDVPKPNAP